MKSPKELALDKKILGMLSGKALEVAKIMINDEEIHYLQDYANTVSIKRLDYNDHGPVHMRTVVINALTMMDILNSTKTKFNLEKECVGTFEDSKISVMIAAFLHDTGMAVGRENHERSSAMISMPIIERILSQIYKDNLQKKVIVRSMVLEGILGHMGTQKIDSLESGVILVADGCDMKKGRARIPLLLNKEAKVGDIHKYSSSSIEDVVIEKGKKRPIKITVKMSASVGFFQVEEVLFKKIVHSTIKPYIELYAKAEGRDMKCYL
ncbi:MAG: phosphohydrolase [Candidatus Aenigmarchaeota archaeon]|nr:phosphohydrolase [Candidatus Aenigmarchaeota archaeon]